MTSPCDAGTCADCEGMTREALCARIDDLVDDARKRDALVAQLREAVTKARDLLELAVNATQAADAAASLVDACDVLEAVEHP